MDWNGHNKTKPGRTGLHQSSQNTAKLTPAVQIRLPTATTRKARTEKIRAACPSTYGPAGIKAPSDPICAEVRTGRTGSPDDYFQRSRGYLPSAIIFSMAAIRAGLSSL